MIGRPLYKFDSISSIGISEVPNNSFVVVIDSDGFGLPKQYVKISNGSLNSSSTIGDFISDTSSVDASPINIEGNIRSDGTTQMDIEYIPTEDLDIVTKEFLISDNINHNSPLTDTLQDELFYTVDGGFNLVHENMITGPSSINKYASIIKANKSSILVSEYEDDDNGSNSGAVYIYDLDGTNEVKIIASDGLATDYFGKYIDINTKIIVGAPNSDSSGIDSGAVYIYDLDGTNEVKITPSDAIAGKLFGTGVAISDSKIIIGAPKDDDNGSNSGAVYIYDLDGTNEVKITPSDAIIDDEFGYNISITDTKMAIGSPLNSNTDSYCGAVYIYDLDGTNEVKIIASDGVRYDDFGKSLYLSNNKIIIGSSGKNSRTGAVYIYDLDGTNEVKIIASDGAIENNFGSTVAITESNIIVGAYGNTNLNYRSGAVYIYDLDGTNEVKIGGEGANYFFGTSVEIINNLLLVGASGAGKFYTFEELPKLSYHQKVAIESSNNYTNLEMNKLLDIEINNLGSLSLEYNRNFSITPTGDIELSFINLKVGQSGNIILNNTNARTITKDILVLGSTNFLADISLAGTYWLRYYSDGINVYVTTSSSLS